jgi:hypothetical protein
MSTGSAVEVSCSYKVEQGQYKLKSSRTDEQVEVSVANV